MKNKYLTKNECRNIQVELLKKIAEICDNNNLKYYLCGGTLLGAIRHKGFIPWDDDIDISLQREDYDKLIEILKKQKDYKWISVLDSEVPGYYYTFAKVVDNRTIAKMEDNITEHGLWVDIFPYDNLPQDEKKCNKFLKKCYIYRSFIMAMTTDFTAKKIKKRFVKRLLNIFANIYGKQKLLKKYQKYSRKYNNIETDYFGTTFTPYATRERFNKKWFSEIIKVEFENYKFNSPIDYDSALKQLYGNYMELPPIEKRREHRIIAWRIDNE